MPRSAIACLGLLLLLSVSAQAQSGTPLTADLAKKCRAMTVKAYPPVPAGSTKGTAQAERDYFKKCIDGGGKVQN